MASKRIRMLSSVVALGVSMSVVCPYAKVYAQGVTSVNALYSTKRLSGKDRYLTSIEISKDGWKNGSEYVILVGGTDFPDALCAAPLAKKYNAPILLAPKILRSKEVLEEVKRLNAKHVIIVGGEGTVSKTIAKDIQKLNSSLQIERIAGSDRYNTAVKVAEKIGTNKVVVSTGKDYADALSISAIAAEKGMPILLTEKDKLPQSVKSFINGKDISKAYIVGGTGAVSLNVEKEFKNVKRLGGQDRYDTNRNILNVFANEINFKKVYMAVGGPFKTDFADALSASSLAAKTSSPIILVNKIGRVAESTKELSAERLLPGTEIITLGGKTVLSDKKANSLKISAISYKKDGETKGSSDSTKPESIKENISVFGNEITFQNVVASKNVYLEGNKATLKNVKVDGIIYVHPGRDGISNLENVEAKTIKILSGAKESIHLKNVKADKLEIASKEEARVVAEENTVIKETNVSSSSIIQTQGTASFGKVVISESTQDDKVITIIGNIGEVVVEGKVKQVKLADGAVVGRLVAKVDVEIEAPNAQIKEIQAGKSVVVKPANASTKLPEIKPIDNTVPVPIPTPIPTPGPGPGPTPGPGPVTPSTKSAIDRMMDLVDGITINSNYANREVRVQINKNLQDVSAKEIFESIKGIQKTDPENQKPKLLNKYCELSKEKNSAMKALGIKSHNAAAIKQQVLIPFKIELGKKGDFELIKELFESVQSYDQLIEGAKKIQTVPIPQITVEKDKNEGIYKVSKLTVEIGKKSFVTGNGEDGLSISKGNISIDQGILCKQIKTKLGYTKQLSEISLNDLFKNSNSINIKVQFTNEKDVNEKFEYILKIEK